MKVGYIFFVHRKLKHNFTIKGRLQKKNFDKCHIWGGGGPDVKMSQFYKLCLKSISSHSESFWKKNLGEKWEGTPILRHFSPILEILKLNLSGGAENFFLQKCPKSDLVS